MARPVPSPLRAVAAVFDAVNGRIRVELNRDPRQSPDAPSMLYPRHLMRGPIAEVVYPIERRMLEVLRFLMVTSLAAFLAEFEEIGGKAYLTLFITPPDEQNRYGVIGSGSYLLHVLGQLVGEPDQKDYGLEFSLLIDPDSASRIGFNAALVRVGRPLGVDLLRLLDVALQAETLNLPPGD